LPVAVLAGERAAIGGDQVSGVLHEPAVGDDAVSGVEVERDAGVHAALAEVPVQARHGLVGVAEAFVESLQIPQVVTEPLRRHRGVLPALPRVAFAGHVRGGAQPRFADLPQLVLVRGIVEERDVRVVLGLAERVEQALTGRVDLVAGVGAELHHQVGGSARQFLPGRLVEVLDPLVGQQPVVHALQGDRLVRQHRRSRVGGGHDVLETKHEQ
jgi:hypothetical protein